MKSKLAVVACLSSLFFLNGCSRTTAPADVEYDHSQSPYHTVKKGDSIASVAQRYSMDKKEVVRLNGLKPPYKIFVGQKLLITTTASAKAGNVDAFEAPASEGTTEMRGDVEVTTLQPMQGTEPHNNQEHADAPLAGEPVHSAEEADAPVAGSDAETGSDVDEKSHAATTETPKMPAATGSYLWPVKGKIIKGFETKADGNKGINISAPQATKVAAANNGIVAYTGNTVPGMGNVVLIKHSNGYMTVYAHLSEIQVKKNQQVTAGQKIGTVGKSGNVKEPQLHFEIRNGKTPIDPTDHLN